MTMNCIDTFGGSVTYQTVREAMDGRPFTMSLTGDDIEAVVEAVNQGIDSHLEACFCPDRGDRYDGGKRMAGRTVLCGTLDCVVSPESLPVLLRRLFDAGSEAAMALATDILTSLGIDECGDYVGREALGLV
jgi:hypothetical protein